MLVYVCCVAEVTYDSLFHKKNVVAVAVAVAAVAVAVAAAAAVAAAVAAKNENADDAFDAFLLLLPFPMN